MGDLSNLFTTIIDEIVGALVAAITDLLNGFLGDLFAGIGLG